MTNRKPAERNDFVTWLEEQVQADPEARQAASEEEVSLYLARALREAREAAGMTQALVAEASGLRQSMVSRLESPNHNPTVASIVRFLGAVQAELVVNVRVGDTEIPATRTAERTVTLPQAVCDRASAQGLSLREYVLYGTARREVADELALVVRRELRSHVGALRSWMQTQQLETVEPVEQAAYESDPELAVAA